jgi:peptidoglycan-N-acetylglucosamine deacetylase
MTVSRWTYVPLALAGTLVLGALRAGAQEFPSPQGEHRVLVTVDDLPIAASALHLDPAERDRITRNLLAALRKHRIEAVGFVVSGNVSGPADEALLELWLEAGHELGSHTHRHLDYSRTDGGAYIEDAEAGRSWMQEFLATRGRALRLFRFPFLREGDTREKLDGMRAWLASRGLRNTPVTIDGQDWSFEAPWVKARRAGDDIRLRRLSADYQTALRLEVATYTTDGDAILERTTPQVLLLHANEVGAAQWDSLFTWMEGEGFSFAPAAEVLADPAIASLPDFVGRYGGSHWYRIRQERRETKAREQVAALLARQAEAWSRGDLDAFCSVYADDAVFVSPGGVTRGRQAVLERYQARYPDRRAMGALRLEVLELRSLWGPEVSLLGDALPGAVHGATVTARWTIESDGGSKAEGLTLLVLHRSGDTWRVVSDASM